MAISHPIPVDVLRQLLRLDAETGLLYWLPRGPEWFKSAASARTFASRFSGKEAFTSASPPSGYRQGEIFHRRYLAHRVVFALAHGRWPIGVDHVDGDPQNNRLSNLREAGQRQNGYNVGSKGGRSGYCGVHMHKGRSKWIAQCRNSDGRTIHLGSFADEIDAARAYDRAAKEWHGEFARLNFPSGD